MSFAQLIPVVAVLVAVCAAMVDVRKRRIPNRLTYPAAIAGLVLQLVLNGWKGMLQAAMAGLLFGALFLLFYLVKGMGAGDVKLGAALGCIVGPAVFQIMLATALAGAVLAIVLMVASGRVLETLRNTLWVVGFHAQHGLQSHPVVNLDNPSTLRLPYGLAFAAGTLYWAAFMHVWR